MVLVTGGTGFVGGAVVRRLYGSGRKVRIAARRATTGVTPGPEVTTVDDLAATTDWRAALSGVDAVVHAAARVHVMRDTAADPLTEFRRVNVAGTLALARQAANTGVRRFVFLSSIKALGESTTGRPPFRADEIPAPVDPYGISKLEAETALRQLALSTGLEVVIIRPVLVHGPGVKGNFRSMMRWLHRGIPLPLGAVHNRRSIVGLDNLVDLVASTLEHPAAPGRTFLVSDGEDLSTTDLLSRTATALGRTARLVPVPANAIELAARAVGRGQAVARLLGSLQVDTSGTREILGWAPPVSVDEGLRRAAAAYLAGDVA